MWKKIFAASAAAVGAAGILGSGSVFAGSALFYPYTSGQNINLSEGDAYVCLQSLRYDYGNPITADIRGTNYEKQYTFKGDFVDLKECIDLTDIPAGSKLRFITPMGLDDMTYVLEEEGNQVIGVTIRPGTSTSKYLRSYGAMMGRIEKSVATITLDANGGSGILPVITGVETGTSVTLPNVTLTRTGYNFAGWNTKADGTGTPYANGATIPIAEAGAMQLFAQWDPMAVLSDGYAISQKLRRLANPENASSINYFSRNSNIKAIRAANSLPEGFDVTNDDNIISANIITSPAPIYAWFDNDDNNSDGDADGIMYVYTDADKIYGNATMNYAFYDMRALSDISALATWDMSKVRSLQGMFREAVSLSDISPLSDWDVSDVTNMKELFNAGYAITDVAPIAAWDTSKVVYMDSMFGGLGATSIDALETKQHSGKDYVSWDVSNVKSMVSIFASASLEDVSALASWDVSNVGDMSSAFYNAGSLTDISPLATWNVANVKQMNEMFARTAITNADALETKQHEGKDYVSWDVSNVENMGSLFWKCFGLTDISALETWNTAKTTNMGGMFNGATSLVDISSLDGWNTSSVVDMGSMFASTAITNADALETKRHEGKAYVSWDISGVTITNGMFSDCESLVDISALASWDTSSVINMSLMFREASSLVDISPLAGWNTSNVEDIGGMFSSMESLSDISPLASWDTSKVTSMQTLFWNTINIRDLSPLATWNTSNVTSMRQMFVKLWISTVEPLRTTQRDGYVSWDVSKVEDMNSMFWNCLRLTDISALGSWNISSVTNMGKMFMFSYALNDLSPIFDWAVGASVDVTDMFTDISSSAVLPEWYHQ